jgi:hypothetical protein
MNQGPRCVVLMKKNGGEKSHATVPLTPVYKNDAELKASTRSGPVHTFRPS